MRAHWRDAAEKQQARDQVLENGATARRRRRRRRRPTQGSSREEKMMKTLQDDVQMILEWLL